MIKKTQVIMKKKINKQTYGRGPYNYKERWNK